MYENQKQLRSSHRFEARQILKTFKIRLPKHPFALVLPSLGLT